MEIVKVKAKFRNTSRRFEIASDIEWNQLEALLQEYFELPPLCQTKYIDDEGELVLLSSQGELEEAFRLNRNSNGLLRLFITEDPLVGRHQENSQQLSGQMETKRNANATSIYSSLASKMSSELSAIPTPPAPTEKVSASGCIMAEPSNAKNPPPQMPQASKQTQTQVPGNQPTKKSGKSKSCYVNLAEVMAAELAELTINTPSGDNNATSCQGTTAAASKSSEASGGDPSAFQGNRQHQRPVAQQTPSCATKKNTYTLLAEEMAKEFAEMNAKFNKDPNPQKKGENLPVNEEEQTGQLTVENENSPLCTPMVTPTQGCNRTQANAMPPDLTAVNLQLQRLKLERAHTEEPNNSPNNDELKSHQKSIANAQQTIGNQKRPKRQKKHPKKKGCYTQLAETMAPDFAALNAILMQQMQQKHKKPDDTQLEVASNEGQGEVEEDSFVLINPGNTDVYYQSFDQSDNGRESKGEIPLITDDNGRESTGEMIPLITEHPLVCGDEVLTPVSDDQVSSNSSVSSDTSTQDEEIIDQEPCSSSSSAANCSMSSGGGNSVKEIVEECIQQHLQPFLTQLKSKDSPGKQNKVVHKGITCDHCENTILGIRYKCCNCPDYDLCETCEDITDVHDPRHAFIKLKYSAPGIGRKHGGMMSILRNLPYKDVLKEIKQKEKQEKKEQQRTAKELKIEERKAKRAEEKREEQRRPETMMDKGQGKDALCLREQRKGGVKEWKKQWKDMKRVHKMEKHQLKMLRRRRAEMRMHEEMSNPAVLPKPLGIEFVDDASYPDGSLVPPGRQFVKKWIVKNDGVLQWSNQMKFENIEGTIPVYPNAQEQVVIPELEPGQQGEIIVEMMAPQTPGSYDSKWQFIQSGQAIGPQFWCDIEVVDELPSHPTYDRHSLSDEALTDTSGVPFMNVLQTGEAPANDGSGSEYLSSEDVPTATVSSSSDSCVLVEALDQTTLDLEELDWDATGCDVDKCIIYSDSSDDDLMVVPVPPCFHPEVSLNADPINVTVSMRQCDDMIKSASLPSLMMDSYNDPTNSEPYISSGPTSLPSVSHTPTLWKDENDQPLEQELQAAEEQYHQDTDSVTSVTHLISRGPPCHDEYFIQPTALPLPLYTTPPISAEPSQYQDIPTEAPPISTQPSTRPDDIVSEPVIMHATPPVSTEPSQITIPRPQESGNATAEGTPPISIQPSIGSEDAVPAPEPSANESTPVTTLPSHVTIPRYQQSEEHSLRRDTGESFPGNVVSDALATAIDAVATAGRAAMATVENLISGNNQAEVTATYQPDSIVEVSVQPSHNETQHPDAPPPPVNTWQPRRPTVYSNMDRLIEMGFGDRRANQQLLNKHKNSLQATINELLSVSENDWPEGRH